MKKRLTIQQELAYTNISKLENANCIVQRKRERRYHRGKKEGRDNGKGL